MRGRSECERIEKIVRERWKSEWEWEMMKREIREWVSVIDSEERDERLSERSECERNGRIWGVGKREMVGFRRHWENGGGVICF